MADLAGSIPSHSTNRPSLPSVKSRDLVGDRYSRMPSTASGLMIDDTQMATMPTVSSQPNSRIIGTFDSWIARKANTASKVTTRSAGPSPRAASWIGCGEESMTTSSSMRECIWIA